MMKLVVRCHKHPGYNPMRSGLDSIKGNCELCISLYHLNYEMQRLKRLPPKKYWGGLGNFKLPLLLLFPNNKRTNRTEPGPPSTSETPCLPFTDTQLDS